MSATKIRRIDTKIIFIGVPQGMGENKKSIEHKPSTLQEFMNFPEPLIGMVTVLWSSPF